MNRLAIIHALLPALCLASAPVLAQHGQSGRHDGHARHGAPVPTPARGCTAEHAAMGHCTPGQVPAPAAAAQPADTATCTPAHAAMGHCTPTPPAARPACPPEHAAMGHCRSATDDTQAPREPIPPLTDDDRAAAFPDLHHNGMDHGPQLYALVRLDRLEAWDADPGTGQAWEGSASWGGDVHRALLRSEGERLGGRTSGSEVELLYSRGISPWWDLVAGVQHVTGDAPARSRAAIGLQGLAPQLFEVSATAYLGGRERVSATLEAEYELLLTNRLVLQPVLELELHGRDDPQRGLGRGLAKAEAGLRLRYEVHRRFAPYVGVAHERLFGGTADAHRAHGEPARETRIVAGIRTWF